MQSFEPSLFPVSPKPVFSSQLRAPRTSTCLSIQKWALVFSDSIREKNQSLVPIPEVALDKYRRLHNLSAQLKLVEMHQLKELLDSWVCNVAIFEINLSLPSSYLIMKPLSESQTRHVAPRWFHIRERWDVLCGSGTEHAYKLQDLKHILIVSSFAPFCNN